MIRVTVLVDNTAVRAKQRAEHGLSMLIERDSEAILFDTGQTDAIIHNANVIGVDLTKIKKIVLSHGHYDHVGGLKYVLDYTKPKVYAHPEIFRKRYSRLSDDGNLRYIGIEEREFFESMGAKFVLREEPVEVIKGVFTTGFESMTTGFEEVDNNFAYEKNGELVKDNVEDDMSIVLDSKDGLFVLFGCAHRGIINIILDVEKKFGKKVVGFAGGTHLGAASEKQRNETIKALKGMNLKMMGPSHCTGIEMTARLHCEFGNRVFFNNIGNVIELE